MEREKGGKGREEMERGKEGKRERQVKHYSELRKQGLHNILLSLSCSCAALLPWSQHYDKTHQNTLSLTVAEVVCISGEEVCCITPITMVPSHAAVQTLAGSILAVTGRIIAVAVTC